MLLGYNTNGFAHHRLEDAIQILADIGYRSVAITLDHHALNPFDADIARQVTHIRGLLDRVDMRCAIETGARFLLDPRRKHQPTLLDPDEPQRAIRRAFLLRSIEMAGQLGATCVSLWSGARPPGDDTSDDQLFRLLSDELQRLCEKAAGAGVRLAFEPEPGMFIETMAQYSRLSERVNTADFGLTLDVGHLHCLGDGEPADQVARWKAELVNVHIEDMRRGVHDHLMFGEGEMAFPPILRALRDASYRGGLHVELSRHSHDAVRVARASYEFLSRCLADLA